MKKTLQGWSAYTRACQQARGVLKEREQNTEQLVQGFRARNEKRRLREMLVSWKRIGRQNVHRKAHAKKLSRKVRLRYYFGGWRRLNQGVKVGREAQKVYKVHYVQNHEQSYTFPFFHTLFLRICCRPSKKISSSLKKPKSIFGLLAYLPILRPGNDMYERKWS